MNTLAERLKYAMETLPLKKVKGVALARAVGVTPPSVSDWLSGKSKTMEGENLVKAAKFLGVDSTWLATGKGEPTPNTTPKVSDSNIRPVDDQFIKIPVLDFVQAGNWRSVGYDGVTPMDYTYIAYKGVHGDAIFALVVDGDSMTPDFKQGDMIVVDTQKQPTPGCYVVAQNGEIEATFKKYKVSGYDDNGRDVFELVPLNDDYPTLYSNKQHIEIIGVVIQHVRCL